MARTFRLIQFVSGVLTLLALSGCAAPPGAAAESAATAPGSMTPGGDALRQGVNAESFLAAGENGLEVRQWVLSTNSEQVAAALMRFRDGDPLAQRDREALERNGLRLVRVPMEELDGLLADLGAPSRNVVTWFGQVNNWRDVLTSSVDETSKSLVVGGRVRRFSDGDYSLMLRSWTLLMEDMPKVQLELLARHTKTRLQDSVPLLGDRKDEATWLHAIRAELQLEQGYAYVLVFESPGVEWREPGENELVRYADGEPAPDALVKEGTINVPVSGGASTGRGQVGPFHDTGLDALAPATLGEVLLGRTNGQPRRHLLAFVPRIPARLFPADLASHSEFNQP